MRDENILLATAQEFISNGDDFGYENVFHLYCSNNIFVAIFTIASQMGTSWR